MNVPEIARNNLNKFSFLDYSHTEFLVQSSIIAILVRTGDFFAVICSNIFLRYNKNWLSSKMFDTLLNLRYEGLRSTTEQSTSVWNSTWSAHESFTVHYTVL